MRSASLDKAFSRKELHAICERAEGMASLKGMSSEWVGTYRKLAEAAEELDRRWDGCELRFDLEGSRHAGCVELRFPLHQEGEEDK